MNGSESDRFTAQDLATALGKTDRAIRKRAKKENWPHDIGPKGAKKFRLTDLPPDIQKALAEKDAVPVSLIPELAPEAQLTAYKKLSIYNNDRVPVGSPELTEWQNRIGLAWADFLRAYIIEKNRAKAAKESVVQAAKLFVKGYNTGQLLPSIFEILGETSWKTAEAKLKKFRQGNYDYTVLAPRWGNRRGQRKVTDEEFNTLLSFALHPNRLRISEVIRVTKLSLRKRYLPSPSSEATLRRALEDWRKAHYDQWVFCREGEKGLMDKCLPYIERDASLLDVGEVLVADGHVLNFQVLHPFTGKPCRVAMVMWYDWASCYPVGWEIMPTENVQSIAAGLRHAILTLGKMPKVAYLDNGKAFKARIFTSTDIDFEEAGFYGMFARLGIETIFAWPYMA